MEVRVVGGHLKEARAYALSDAPERLFINAIRVETNVNSNLTSRSFDFELEGIFGRENKLEVLFVTFLTQREALRLVSWQLNSLRASIFYPLEPDSVLCLFWRVHNYGHKVPAVVAKLKVAISVGTGQLDNTHVLKD